MKTGRTRTIKVDYLARVEGEGALYIKLKGEQVQDVKLKIFEPPRFFEAFLRGRMYSEAPDITARICGICPIAYQMSSSHAMEDAFGVTVGVQLRALRRLIYCGEWIESHVLHISMLHAPDFLGYADAIQMAKDHPETVQQALRLKKTGNEIVRLLGGREIHPINVRVGGFYKAPTRRALASLVDDLKWGRDAAIEMVRWTAALPFPDFERDYEFVALHREYEYAILNGTIRSSRAGDLAEEDFEKRYLEYHVPHSNALHSRTVEGRHYIVGPLARFNLNFAQLHPLARQAAEAAGIVPPVRNPYKALLARAAETIHAYAVALEIARVWMPRGPSRAAVTPRSGEGAAATEAPRGLLYHRYRLDAGGLVEEARIVPPTAQNLARMEDDLRLLAPHVLTLPLEEATLRCEHLVRAYDPCISCATHFLTLHVERV